MSSPGSTHDSSSFNSSEFAQKIDEYVPEPYWIAGDDAYGCTEKLLTPYPGSHDFQSVKDTFNFYHSGCNRIFIECAFGILVRRWGILWKPLEMSLDNNARIIMVCMLLHNFCTRRGFSEDVMSVSSQETDAAGFAPVIHFQDQLHLDPQQGRRRDLERSKKRQILALLLHESGRRRPEINRRL